MMQMQRRSYVLIVTLAFLVSCGGPAVDVPELQPVSGRLLDESGQPVASGELVFQPMDSPEWAAYGSVNEDGTFGLETRVGRELIPGAVAGKHEVTYFPEMSGEQLETPIIFGERVEIGPGENQLELRLESPAS